MKKENEEMSEVTKFDLHILSFHSIRQFVDVETVVHFFCFPLKLRNGSNILSPKWNGYSLSIVINCLCKSIIRNTRKKKAIRPFYCPLSSEDVSVKSFLSSLDWYLLILNTSA